MKLIVGLGNPGPSYADHRHNIGFRVVDLMAARCDTKVEKRAFGAFVGEGNVAGEKVLFVKPQTFMNLSGDAVGPVMRFYKLSIEDVVVIHDDIDIEFGKLKIAKGAGHGGHNGVRSVTEAVGGNDFYRVRMGVGRPVGVLDAADYVLCPFSNEEEPEVDKMVANAADAVEVLFKKGILAAQNLYH